MKGRQQLVSCSESGFDLLTIPEVIIQLEVKQTEHVPFEHIKKYCMFSCIPGKISWILKNITCISRGL